MPSAPSLLSSLSLLCCVVAGACGEVPAVASRTCGFVEGSFSATGPVLQGASDDGAVCARLEREPVEERRGVTWRASRLVVEAPGRSVDAEAGLWYENTHHNCRDVAGLEGADVTLTIDGVDGDPSVCFSPASTAWILRLEIDGEERLLAVR